MYKTRYMGNGSATEFYFTFPFFEESNIIVTVNNEPATSYNVIGTPGGLDADIPFVGGCVVFETAPRRIDSIIISRYLPLERIVDHQATSKISTKALNQDANYLLELIKDRKDELDDLITKYSEIADKESTETLLARINAIHEEIVAIDAKITNLGNIDTLRQDVTTNTNDITDLKDASNFTTTGKNALCHMSMPSTHFIDLTLNTSGSSYTAPADGYIYLVMASTAAGHSARFVTPIVTIEQISYASGNWLRLFVPVGKGQNFNIEYSANDTKKYFRFIYANGIA